jgi:hypothetical protein
MKATEDDLICLICKKRFNHLGSHIWHKHKIKAREYKQEFGLPYRMALISESIYQKKKIAFEKNREYYLKNISNPIYRFKKGHTGQRRISQRERITFIEQIKKVNKNRKPEQCMVCKMIFDHLDSHLIMKHKLLRIKEIK